MFKSTLTVKCGVIADGASYAHVSCGPDWLQSRPSARKTHLHRYAVLLGGPAHDPGAMSVDGLVPPAAAPAEAPLALLASDAAACAAWLAAERADVLAHMESLVAAPGAWLPVHSLLQGILDSEGEEEEECAAGAAPGVLGSGGGVLGMTGPHSPGSSPATTEFRPPLLADQVTTLVAAQLRRASLLHDAAHRAAYIEVGVLLITGHGCLWCGRKPRWLPQELKTEQGTDSAAGPARACAEQSPIPRCADSAHTHEGSPKAPLHTCPSRSPCRRCRTAWRAWSASWPPPRPLTTWWGTCGAAG